MNTKDSKGSRSVYTEAPKYKDSDTVSLKLTLDDSTGQMLFIVNGTTVYKSKSSYSATDNGRFVTGAAQSPKCDSKGKLKPWVIT